MKRSEIEHILRACKDITGEDEFIIVGSQCILGAHPDAPRVLRVSMEVDVYPKHRPELSDEIEGTLGRYSMFDQTFGYHADGVSPETATLPADWETRLVEVCNENTNGATGWCLDDYDLAYSKLAAGRDKDLTFVANLLRYKIVRPTRLERVIETAPDKDLRERLERNFKLARRRQADAA